MAHNLPLARIAADLHRDVADLRNSRGSNRMPFRLEPSAGIHWPLAMQTGFAFKHIRAARAFFDKSQILRGDDFGDRETVVQLRELNVSRRHPGHFVSLLRGFSNRPESG